MKKFTITFLLLSLVTGLFASELVMIKTKTNKDDSFLVVDGKSHR